MSSREPEEHAEARMRDHPFCVGRRTSVNTTLSPHPPLHSPVSRRHRSAGEQAPSRQNPSAKPAVLASFSQLQNVVPLSSYYLSTSANVVPGARASSIIRSFPAAVDFRSLDRLVFLSSSPYSPLHSAGHPATRWKCVTRPTEPKIRFRPNRHDVQRRSD
jgi:hypothetical protein